MADSPVIEITVGTVRTNTSKISLSISDGKREGIQALLDKTIVFVGITPKDGRRAGESILLTLDEYAAFKELFSLADAQLERIRAADQSIVCPNCKLPPRETGRADCAFCGYVYP